MLPMYRAGMYANAEYLEACFGVAARVICAFVQVQYRTLVLGLIATAAFLTLSIVSGWSDAAAWGLVGGIAVLAAIYTAFGGLRSVAVTDTLQFGVMTFFNLSMGVMGRALFPDQSVSSSSTTSTRPEPCQFSVESFSC